MRALVASGVEKRYENDVVVRDLNLFVQQGERVALIGANGSGKTTFLRMAAGTLDISEGGIEVMGHAAGSVGARAELSFIADTPVFYDDLSLIEHLEYIAGLHGATDWVDRAWDLARRLRIEDRMDNLPTTFSRGLRQKAAIAIGFIRPAQLLLIDEPYVGLDTAGRVAFDRLLDEANDAGTAMVVATHQFEHLPPGIRCIVLRDGRVIHDGPATDHQLRAFVDG